jgi:hypothetical protein
MSVDFLTSYEQDEKNLKENSASFLNIIPNDVRRLSFPLNAPNAKIDILANKTQVYTRVTFHELPTLGRVTCPKVMKGDSCPICDYVQKNNKKPALYFGKNKNTMWDVFHTKNRILFNSIPLNTAGQPVTLGENDPPNSVYIYDISKDAKNGFWKILELKLKSQEPTHQNRRYFADWDIKNGSSLLLELSKDSFSGHEFMSVMGIEFVPRVYQYSPATWNLYDIDSLVIYLTADELQSHLETCLEVAENNGSGLPNLNGAPNVNMANGFGTPTFDAQPAVFGSQPTEQSDPTIRAPWESGF